jgi:hypothetical protein
MAGYRQFHTKFWKDSWVIDLDPLERYLFSYLFTNEQSSISGIYELPLKIIQNETGLELEFLKQSLEKFQGAKKIFYRDNIMWVVKMQQHHKNASPKTMTKVNNDISWIPDCDVKTAYLYYQKTGIYCIDMVSIRECESVSVIKSESLNESGNEDAPIPIRDIQRMIEIEIGLPPSGYNDIQAMDEMEKMNPTQEDIHEAAEWLRGQNKTIRYYSSLTACVRTAIAKRKTPAQTKANNNDEVARRAMEEALKEEGINVQ